jgi:hypothetical protein
VFAAYRTVACATDGLSQESVGGNNVTTDATMQYERVIRQALRDVQDLLSANLPPSYNLSDHRIAALLRARVGRRPFKKPSSAGMIRALCFILRAANRVLSNTTLPPRAALDRLWCIMDDPDLHRALGLKQNSRMTLAKEAASRRRWTVGVKTERAATLRTPWLRSRCASDECRHAVRFRHRSRAQTFRAPRHKASTGP